MKHDNFIHGQSVEITGNYEYSRSFIGKTGIIVKLSDNGANLFVSAFNSVGTYEDQIFWFPFDCFN